MKEKAISVCLILLLLFLTGIQGCEITEESITNINQQIEDRYNSFSTLKYTVVEVQYEDNIKTYEEETTTIIKKSNKLKSISGINFANIPLPYGGILDICNDNIYFSRLGSNLIKKYEYINLPPEMSSYCNWAINDKLEKKFKVPMEITDQSKYDVETSIVEYNGKNVVKAVVIRLMSEEAKQKQIAIGNTPKEQVVTYWFNMNTFAILKEESNSFGTECKAIEVSGSSSETDCKEIERRVERTYENFQFDINIPDSEFEIDPSIRSEIIDTQENFF